MHGVTMKTVICYHFNDEDENYDSFLDILMCSYEAVFILMVTATDIICRIWAMTANKKLGT